MDDQPQSGIHDKDQICGAGIRNIKKSSGYGGELQVKIEDTHPSWNDSGGWDNPPQISSSNCDPLSTPSPGQS